MARRLLARALARAPLHRTKLRSLLMASGATASGALVLTLVAASGCLVTDKVEFGAPNIPATVKIESPRGPIAIVLPEGEFGCDPGFELDGMRFDVTVSDHNIEDRLQLLFVVNGMDRSEEVTGTGPLESNGQVERKLTLCAPRALLAARPCSNVEILVSRDFSGTKPYGTNEKGDLGVGQVLVSGDPELQPQSPKSDCYTDAGAP